MILDELDKSILEILYKDSRTPFTKIADIITNDFRKKGYIGPNEKIPDTTIHFRVKKLKENNIISKFTISISPKTLGYESYALISLKIGGHILKEISVKRTLEMAEKLAKNPYIRFIAVDDTKTNLHLIIVTKNEQELNNFIEDIKNDPDISEVNTFKLSEIKKGEDMLTPIEG